MTESTGRSVATADALQALVDAAEQALPIVELEVLNRGNWCRACPVADRAAAMAQEEYAEQILFRLNITIHDARGVSLW